MTEQSAPEQTVTDLAAVRTATEAAWRVSQDRSHEISRILNSESTRALMRAVRDDDNIDWLEFLREAGGAHGLADHLTPTGEPDLERVRATVDRVFYRHSETEYQGGVTFKRYPKNRPPRG